MIYFENHDQSIEPVEPQTLILACQKVFETLLPNEQREMSLVITGDEEIQELNRQYREVDSPTDVLSFPAGDLDPESGLIYAGDVLISFPTAHRQADETGNPICSEIVLLAVHGTLHLLGYDHGDDKEKERMWAVQNQILNLLGIQLAKYPD